MIQNRVKLYVRHFYRSCRSTIIDHETRERQLYVIVGNGQPRLRSLTVSKRRRCQPWDSDDGCTLYINLLTKEVQVMHVQRRKCLFLKKTYCLQIPFTSIPPVHCIDLCMKLHTRLPSLCDMYFKFSKCIFSVIIRRL